MLISDAITHSGLWSGLPQDLLRLLARHASAQAVAVRIPLFVAAGEQGCRRLVAHWPGQAHTVALAATDGENPFPPVWPGAERPLIVQLPMGPGHNTHAGLLPDAAAQALTGCVRVAIPMPLDVALECIFYFDGEPGTAPGTAICAEAALQWLPQFRSAMREHAKLLTPREAECLRLAYQGLTAGEVGQRLKCSDRTVNFHYANVMTRLGVRSKLAAVLLLTWLGAI